MSLINFEELFSTLKNEVIEFAKTTAKGYVDEAKKDAENTIDMAKDNLAQWAEQLKNKEISVDELQFLIESQDALIKVDMLKRAGIAAIEIDKFKAGLVEIITSTLSTLI